MTSIEADLLLKTEAQKLNPSALVELFELDATALGEPSVLMFHNGTNGMRETVSFRGNSYLPLPIQVKGLEQSSTERQPRPTLTVANPQRFMSMLMRQRQDLVGAKFTRRATFAKFLDGMPDAAPVEYEPEVYYVERKLHETEQVVELELGTSLDLDGTLFPIRQVSSVHCSHKDYRGHGCDYAKNLCVTDSRNELFAGAAKFRDNWLPSLTYLKDDSVGAAPAGIYSIYVLNVDGPVTGDANSPVNNPTIWTRVQRYRGIYTTAITDWQLNDTAYVLRDNVRTLAMLIIQPAVGEPVPAPPDARYWRVDQCARFLNACKLHFDPRNLNNPLPYGGFPGVLALPDV